MYKSSNKLFWDHSLVWKGCLLDLCLLGSAHSQDLNTARPLCSDLGNGGDTIWQFIIAGR